MFRLFNYIFNLGTSSHIKDEGITHARDKAVRNKFAKERMSLGGKGKELVPTLDVVQARDKAGELTLVNQFDKVKRK